MVVVFPSFLMASSGSFIASIIGVMLLAVGAVLCGVVTAALLSETFPTRTRYRRRAGGGVNCLRTRAGNRSGDFAYFGPSK